jgi:predicted transcriptional regulator
MRGLGQLEATVMGFVWGADRPVSVRDVVEVLQRDRSIAYTTVMTVMDNLHSKDFLGRERVGRAYVYRATRPREQYEAELMEDVLASSSDRSATLMHFVGQISAEELAELRALIAALDETSRA